MSKKTFDPNEHMTNLKGKQYLEVKYRLVWLSQEIESYNIETEIVQMPSKDAPACMKASIALLDAEGKVTRTATGFKTSKGFEKGDLEKAETGAIGRALAFLGFGTQFAEELDGEDSIANPVDTPTESKKQAGSDVAQMTMQEVVAALNANPAPALRAKLEERRKQLKQAA